MAVLWNETFNNTGQLNASNLDRAYTTDGKRTYFPTGWRKMNETGNGVQGVYNPGGSETFGQLTTGYAWQGRLAGAPSTTNWGSNWSSTNQYRAGWVIGKGSTTSNATGPSTGGVASDADGTISSYAQTSTRPYLLFEASYIGSVAEVSVMVDAKRNIGLIRGPLIDLTSKSPTDDITLHGAIHKVGSRTGAFGIAATSDSAHAGEKNEAGTTIETFTGSGFTGYTNNDGLGVTGGGLNLSYDLNGNGTIDTFDKKRIIPQTAGGQNSAFKKFRADLKGAGGSSFYLYFLYEAFHDENIYYWNTSVPNGVTNYYFADCAIGPLWIDEESYVPDTDFKGKIFNISGSSIKNIKGQDLDENDKVIGTDGEGVSTATTKTLVLTGSWDAPSTFAGTVEVFHKSSSGNFINMGVQNFSGYGDITYNFPSNHTSSTDIGVNTSIKIASYPVSGNFEINGTPSFANTNGADFATVSGVSLTFPFMGFVFIRGRWTTNGTLTIDIDWEDTS